MSPAGDPTIVAGTEGLDLVGTCRPMTDGGSDPTWHFGAEHVVRAMSTPAGPVTVELSLRVDGVAARTWGEGGDWLVPRLGTFLGALAPAEFRSDLHPLVHQLHRRHHRRRFGASLRLRDVLVPVVLGQRVTSGEARRSWWLLVRRHGSVAPGPHDVLLPPEPSRLARLSDAQWHGFGVERQRADAIRRCVAVLGSLETAATLGSHQLQQRLCEVPGVGPWTATSLAANVLGDTDALLLGDLHLPNTVSFLLTGAPRGDDARMCELLEPWRGHRARVARLLTASGRTAPRRAPKYVPLPIARW